jgi:cell wall assembly regulator SMI1
MQALLRRLDKWLAKHRTRFYKNLRRGATRAQLQALQKHLGRPVPKGLAELLAWRNGQGDDYVGYFENHWLLMSAEKIAAVKAELDESLVDQGWNKSWLPFLDDDGGNFASLDLSQKEAPVMIFWAGAQPEKKAPSLEAWLREVVHAMETGRYYEDPERGTFDRTKAKR